jgi:hypothetical protein
MAAAFSVYTFRFQRQFIGDSWAEHTVFLSVLWFDFLYFLLSFEHIFSTKFMGSFSFRVGFVAACACFFVVRAAFYAFSLFCNFFRNE